MRLSRKPAAWQILLTLMFITSTVQAASREEAVKRLDEYRQFFLDFQQAPDNSVPADLLAECSGVIIMRQYKGGFVFGVKGGSGVILMHDKYTGEWSAPAFLVSGEGSFGLQIGGQSIDAIILIMNQIGVDMLLKTRFQIGVDASAAAGPVGRDAWAKVGPGTALLAYSRTRGLYAGATFEGGTMLNYDKMNRALYGNQFAVRDIVINRAVAVPPEAYGLIEALQSYTGKGSVQPTPTTVAAPVPEEVPQPYQPPLPYQPDQDYGYAPLTESQPHTPEPYVSQPYTLTSNTEQRSLDEAAAQAAAVAQAAADAAATAQQAADEASARAAARGQK